MSTPENPPAFPRDERYLGHNGMTLRDWFAGQALNGLLSNPKLRDHILAKGGAEGGWIEESAYAFADEMLTEREKAS